jgi:hypothetical protein
VDQTKQDEAILNLLVHQLSEYRLPRIQRMLKRLDEGEKLTDVDIQHLKREYDESMKDWRPDFVLWFRFQVFRFIGSFHVY